MQIGMQEFSIRKWVWNVVSGLSVESYVSVIQHSVEIHFEEVSYKKEKQSISPDEKG